MRAYLFGGDVLEGSRLLEEGVVGDNVEERLVKTGQGPPQTQWLAEFHKSYIENQTFYIYLANIYFFRAPPFHSCLGPGEPTAKPRSFPAEMPTRLESPHYIGYSILVKNIGWGSPQQVA